MTDDDAYDGPRLSYSGLSDLTKCGELYRLKRVVKVPREAVPWYLPSGVAAHALIEAHNRRLFGDDSMPDDPAVVLEQTVVEFETESGIPREEFDVMSVDKKPCGYDQVLALLPVWTDRWKRWLNASPYQIAVTPDGTPAIELTFDHPIAQGRTPGFIDVVVRNTAHQGRLEVVDAKFGSTTPKSLLQPAIYGKVAWSVFDEPVWKGSFWMGRKTSAQQHPADERWRDLGNWYKILDRTFDTAYRTIEQGLFLPNEGEWCFRCDAKAWCRVKNSDVPF